MVKDAVDYAASLGVVFVAAAGNSGEDARTFYPAGFAKVITVAASDASDALAYFSNRGPKIDVSAPGVDILSVRGCRYVITPDHHAAGRTLADLRCCNNPRVPGLSWCLGHCRMVYR